MRVLFSPEAIARRVAALAGEAFLGDTMLVMPVLEGARPFADDFCSYLPFPVERRDIQLRSYVGTESSGSVEFLTSPGDVRGREVLVLEDIVDSGRTMTALTALLRERGAQSVQTAALLYKPSRSVTGFVPEHIGFTIPDRFVIGYGMDLDGRYRELPYIAEYK